MATVVLLAV
jgi:hypothetical protein